MPVTLAFFSDIGGGEMLIVAVIALLLFGKSLPTTARTVGKTIAQFKHALNSATSELKKEMDNAAEEIDKAAKSAELDKTVDDLRKIEDNYYKEPPSLTTTPSTPAPATPSIETLASLDKPIMDYSTPATTLEKSRAPIALSQAAGLDNLERNIPAPTKIPPPLA